MVDSRKPWTLARFSFEGETVSFLGYHKGDKWNGFPIAYFELPEAKRLASHLVQNPDSGYGGFFFEKTSDTLALLRTETASDRIKGEDIVEGHARTVHVYGIGAGLTLHLGPALCEACPNVLLTEDFQCPTCNVSHTGLCGECGRFGYHKEGCSESDATDGPSKSEVLADRLSKELTEELALVRAFEKEHAEYNGWTFAFEHPGFFAYHDARGELTVCFTPDFNEPNVADVQITTSDGDPIQNVGGAHEFKTDRSAAALFAIVKPYLDKYTGKSADEVRKEGSK